jgi:pre-mRNA-processing factor 19
MCSVSGEPPKHPVFSKTTGTTPSQFPFANHAGNVFEKHLLEAYLTEHSTDPVTNSPASPDDYVELKGN